MTTRCLAAIPPPMNAKCPDTGTIAVIEASAEVTTDRGFAAEPGISSRRNCSAAEQARNRCARARPSQRARGCRIERESARIERLPVPPSRSAAPSRCGIEPVCDARRRRRARPSRFPARSGTAAARPAPDNRCRKAAVAARSSCSILRTRRSGAQQRRLQRSWQHRRVTFSWGASGANCSHE
jgi:hypothetical protein